MPLWILTYHALDDARGPTSISPALFADQVQTLNARGFRFVRLSEGLRELAAVEPARRVALTFDDGYASVATIAAPILVALGVPATVFPVAGQMGGTNRWPSQLPTVGTAPLMDWPDLQALARAGWEVGAHGESHADLTGLDASALERELAAGPRLADRLGVAVESLAYPYGRHDSRVRRAAAGAGYRFGVTTDLRVVPDGVDPLAVPRIDAWYLRPGARAGALGSRRTELWLAARRAGRAARVWLEDLGVTSAR